MPAGRFGEADRGKRDGHRVHLGRPDAGELEAELRCFVRHAVLGVLVTDETFLLGGGDEAAVDIERSRGVVGQCAGQSE
jgi:hypothetical protein